MTRAKSEGDNGGRSVRGKQRNTKDSWACTLGDTDCGSGGGRVGVSNGEKGRTTVTDQQSINQ